MILIIIHNQNILLYFLIFDLLRALVFYICIDALCSLKMLEFKLRLFDAFYFCSLFICSAIIQFIMFMRFLIVSPFHIFICFLICTLRETLHRRKKYIYLYIYFIKCIYKCCVLLFVVVLYFIFVLPMRKRFASGHIDIFI